MNDDKQFQRIRWLVWVTYVACWTAALLTPHPVRLADSLLGDRASFLSAKVLHVGAYAVLAMLSGWLRLRRPYCWLLLCVMSAHALATEFLQRFVPLRVPAWADVGWDHLGVILGMLLTWKSWFKTGRRRGVDYEAEKAMTACATEPESE